MPIYEEMRDGWDDYRPLAALRQGGQEDVVQQLLSGYRDGRPLAAPRTVGLRAVKTRPCRSRAV